MQLKHELSISYRQQRRPARYSKHDLLRSFFFLLSTPFFSHGREADDRSRFLYADDPSATIILEYQLHNAPSKDYSIAEREESFVSQITDEYDVEKNIKPYFLMPGNGPRVVEYYSPWCGHCQSYKTKYIALAKEINLRTQEQEIVFHAISCSVYHWVCLTNNITAFPTIVAFKENSVAPILLKEPTVDDIAESLGIQLKPIDENIVDLEKIGDDAFRPIDILGASMDGLARTREAVYIDAALSFTHALKTEIFHNRGSYLDPIQREVFSDWIDLLYWTLPPTWILHTLINDIRNNIDSVIVSETNLLHMVEKHNEVVNGKDRKWSKQCSKGVDGVGYPCGLWSLFHVVSIGVKERHRAVLGAQDQVSTKYAALTMRNYIEHFFGCESCRQYFLAMYDSCGFNHCRRFKQPKKLPSSESWSQFALWLWEVHNDVNVKLVEAESNREGSTVSNNKLELAIWPSNDSCIGCKDKNGKWDMDLVLSNLRKQYWPAGVQNFRYIVLKKKVKIKDESAMYLKWLETLFFFVLSSSIVICCTRRRHISLTGRHKKNDQEYV